MNADGSMVAVHSGKCVTRGAGAITQEPCNGGPSQRWQMDRALRQPYIFSVAEVM